MLEIKCGSDPIRTFVINITAFGYCFCYYLLYYFQLLFLFLLEFGIMALSYFITIFITTYRYVFSRLPCG